MSILEQKLQKHEVALNFQEQIPMVVSIAELSPKVPLSYIYIWSICHHLLPVALVLLCMLFGSRLCDKTEIAQKSECWKESSEHPQQMKLSQNYSITMSCSFASKRVDIWNWASGFFSARTGGKWFLHKECADLPMCSVLGLVDDRFSVNVSSNFFWYVFTWIFMWRGIQMLKIHSIIKFTSVSHLSKT